MAPDDKDKSPSDDDWERDSDRDDAWPDDALTDRDDDDAPPLSGMGDSAQDPGYAAFSEDFDDPLSDWPTPQAANSGAGEDTSIERSQGDAQLGASPGTRKPPYDPFDDSQEDEVPAQSGGGTGDDGYAEVWDGDLANAGTGDFHSGDSSDRQPPLVDRDEDVPTAAFEDADEYIDDFLEDLDDPPPAERSTDKGVEAATATFGKADDPKEAGPAALALGAMASEADSPDGDPIDRAVEESRQRFYNEGEGGRRGVPLLMIGVALLALVLLGIGGYGVVEERKALQAEIRELQARLATASTGLSAQAAREAEAAQEAMTRRVEQLESQLASLQAENEALQQPVADAEGTPGEPEAPEVVEDTETAPANVVSTAAAAAPTASAPSAGEGAWFVNFGSYAQREVAELWASRLQVDAGSVEVQTAQTGAGTFYRVRIAGLQGRESAERVATALEREFDLPRLWVGKN